MKNLLKFSFLFPLLLFLGHQLSQKIIGYSIPFFDFYVDPFCFTALFFPLFKWERKLLFQQKDFSILELSLVLALLILLFEGLVPIIFSQFTADLLDILAMVIGFLWFLIFDSTYNIKASKSLLNPENQ